MADPLPEFEAPPVTEVVISTQFAPLPNWRGPYAGLFWGEVKNDYPHTQVVAPLPPITENFEELLFQNQIVSFQVLDPDSQRFWFLSDPGTELIQLQKDRFIVNWRQVKGDEVYPRYEPVIRPRFVKELTRFRKFALENKLGNLENIQCEVTYINDFVQGNDWKLFPEAMSLLSNWVAKGSSDFLPSLETININGSFLMPSGSGRLSFAVQHVLRQIDAKQAIQLRLVARGNPKSDSDDDILKWVDFAREWIVRGFTDLTSAPAHKLWKRKR